jgi:hypothetical protein
MNTNTNQCLIPYFAPGKRLSGIPDISILTGTFDILPPKG